MNAPELKAIACAYVDDIGGELLAISHDIHAHPELAYNETHAAAALVDALRRAGLSVTAPAFGMATSFVAERGQSGANVVVCLEYDALPAIGHGCGHNVIAAAGLGAGLALAQIAERAGGRVTILGCPAEEGGGGKIRLLDAGAFVEADVAMMVHPEPANVEYAPYLAVDRLVVTMHGKAAHASSSARHGINALDALVLGYSGLHSLRQRLAPDQKVHAIITEGGVADNIIPDRAVAVIRCRARTEARLQRVRTEVEACFLGGALQIGATADLAWEGGYRDMQSNRTLARAFRRNGEQLGRTFVDPTSVPVEMAGSTDMGNVSYAVASIHPVIDIGRRVAGHSAEMTVAAVEPGADRAVIDGAKMLAMTAIDVWTDGDLLDAARAEFALLQ